MSNNSTRDLWPTVANVIGGDLADLAMMSDSASPRSVLHGTEDVRLPLLASSSTSSSFFLGSPLRRYHDLDTVDSSINLIYPLNDGPVQLWSPPPAAHHLTSLNSSQIDIQVEISKKLAGKAGPYQCSTCERKFARRSALKIHRRTHTGEAPYQCLLCGQIFSQISNIRRHIERHKIFPREAVNGHSAKPDDNIVQSSGSTTITEKCYFKKNKSLKELQYTCFAYSCWYCSKRFDCKKCVKKHTTSMHSDKKVFKCPSCGLNHAKLEDLLNHISEQHASCMIYRCKFCQTTYSKLDDIYVHYCVHRVKDSSRITVAKRKRIAMASRNSVKCKVCGRCYENVRELKRHVVVCHSTEKIRFSCDFCSKTYSYVFTLNLHKRVHNIGPPTKNFACDLCCASFSRRDSLNRHATSVHRTKNLPQPFLCKVDGCGLAFGRKDVLSDHVTAKHGQETDRPRCQICGKSYSRLRALNQHISETHDRKFKHICATCGKGYGRRALLEKHVAKCR